MEKTIITASGYSHIGNVRTVNEDNIYMNGKYIPQDYTENGFLYNEDRENGVNIYAVCDGMGGESNGEIAALIAVGTLQNLQKKLGNNKLSQWDGCISEYIAEANEEICAVMREKKCRMGCTLALACIYENTARIYNLGDSRVYLLTGDTLTQISHDHSVAQQLLDIKLITPEEAARHPKRNRLTQYLGAFEKDLIIEPHVSEVRLRKNDTLMICSDGLTNMCPDEEIETVMKKCGDAKKMTDELIYRALFNGGNDNISVITVKFC